jgi:hypothetical protein
MQYRTPSQGASRIRFRFMPIWIAALVAVLPQVARSAVVRVEMRGPEPFAGGHAFGQAGPYERITGRLYLEVDPQDPANQRVVDLKLAPRNADGKVEFSTDFFLLKPADPLRGNRRLFYDVSNRGNKLALSAFNNARSNNPTTPADAGNGFLMRQGYSILWCGWNGDVAGGDGRLEIQLPVAHAGAPDGKGTIEGKIYAEICTDQKSFSQPLYWGNSKPYPPVDLDNRSAVLTMRPLRTEPAVEIPRDQWAFARWENDKPVPDPACLYIKEGFRAGWLYELVYTGKDPRVTGLGFAAVRDAVSFFRYEARDRKGAPNPLAGAIERAYVFGISQSARFIHHFLYEDFNGDEKGLLVFDAAFAHVGAAGRGLFNSRFAQTTRHGSHHEDNLYPADIFPFATVPSDDPLTGQRGDALAAVRKSGRLPKIFFTETSTEYWARAGSLLHTDVEGKRDVPIDPNARLYFLAGAQHGVSTSSDRGIYRNQVNTLDHRPLLRALLVALDQWVTTGQEPPPSRYPHIADGTLVDLEKWRQSFPRIPNVNLPKSFYAPLRLDMGPRWTDQGIADFVPPKVGQPYRTLVSAVDADGNEVAGIRLPDVAVPLAAYSGWNLRGAACGAEGMLARWTGSYWPFPQTPDDRRKSGDPRASVLERYPTREAYLAKVTQAALELQDQRFLLPEDVMEVLRIASTRLLCDKKK